MSKLIRALAVAGALSVLLIAGSARVSAQIGATTYFDQAGKLRMYAFLVKNGNLYVDYWDGSQWKWANQGKPADTTAFGTPAVINYIDTTTLKTHIYAFVLGANGNLYVNYWDGSKWQWANQGKPPATKLDGEPRAITYGLPAQNKQWIYAFAAGVDGYIYSNYWDGTKWQWVKLPEGGAEPGVAWETDPASGIRRIYVFGLAGADPVLPTTLHLNEWNGSKWQGTTQSPIPSFHAPSHHPAVIAYAEAGAIRVYAFVVGMKDLQVHYRSGAQWQWAQQGQPPGTEVDSEASGVTYLSGKQRIHAFVRGADSKLYTNFWDGAKWQWANYGNPPTAMLKDDPAAITFRDPATGRNLMYVFVVGTDDNLYVNYGDVSNRKWANLGKP